MAIDAEDRGGRLGLDRSERQRHGFGGCHELHRRGGGPAARLCWRGLDHRLGLCRNGRDNRLLDGRRFGNRRRLELTMTEIGIGPGKRLGGVAVPRLLRVRLGRVDRGGRSRRHQALVESGDGGGRRLGRVMGSLLPRGGTVADDLRHGGSRRVDARLHARGFHARLELRHAALDATEGCRAIARRIGARALHAVRNRGDALPELAQEIGMPAVRLGHLIGDPLQQALHVPNLGALAREPLCGRRLGI